MGYKIPKSLEGNNSLEDEEAILENYITELHATRPEDYSDEEEYNKRLFYLTDYIMFGKDTALARASEKE